MPRRQANPSGIVTSQPGRYGATLGQRQFKDVDGFEEKHDLVLPTGDVRSQGGSSIAVDCRSLRLAFDRGGYRAFCNQPAPMLLIKSRETWG